MSRISLNKLLHPTLPSTVLYRSGLVQSIIEWLHREKSMSVVLLCTPAGYGKTTLLAEVAQQLSLSCCWCFLDALDAQPVSFLQLLIASIRQQFPKFGSQLDSSLRNIAELEDATQTHQYLITFIDVLATTLTQEISEPFALLLCNYHEIDADKTTNYLIHRFLQRMPHNCTVFFESRSLLPIELTSLLTEERLLKIDAHQLRFSQSEIQELAHLRQINLTDQEAAQLEEAFDGWITGILLGTHLGNIQLPSFAFVNSRALNGSPLPLRRDHLFTYLVSHVFAHQSEAYPFLQETVILRQMTPKLCNALLDISNAASHLAYLEEHGLFITHYTLDTEQFYICHPVVRELLADELQRTNPTRFTELHLRAIELFRGRDDSEAIEHALIAHDFHTAAQLVETIAEQRFTQGHLTTLAIWIDALPVEVLSYSPRLLLTRASIFLEESALSKVQHLLDQALKALQGIQDGSTLHTEILLVQAKLLLQQGEYAQAQQLGRQAMALLPINEVEARAVTHQLLGSCAAYFNNFIACIVELQQALQLYRHNTKIRQVAKLHTMLSNFYGMTGHNALSEHHRTRAIQCWENLQDEWGRIDNIIGLGAIKERQGALEQAEQLFIQALTASRGMIAYQCGEAYALTSLGEIYQTQDKFHQALVAFEDSLALSRQINETYLTHYTLCQLARTYQLIGDAQSALQILHQIEPDSLSLEAGATYSYEQTFYALTLGTILLHQGQAAEAHNYLAIAESAFAETKYEQLQAMIRRTACLLVLGKRQEALQLIESAFGLADEYGYEELLHRELTRYPALLNYVKTARPALIQQITLQEMTPLAGSAVAPSILPASSSRPILRVQALGTPAVYYNDTSIKRWRLARSMELFFLLLDAPYPIQKERIIAALWPDGELPGDQVWRSTLHYLRKILGAECITTRHGTYRLQLETKYTLHYDVHDFQRYYTQAQTEREAGKEELAIQSFETAVQLYTGDYVALFSNSWCVARRDALRQMCIDAYQQLAEMAWRRQQMEKSISHWQHILAMDDTIEIAHISLINCYLQQEKYPQALRQYHYVVDLRKGRGLPLSQELQALHERISKRR